MVAQALGADLGGGDRLALRAQAGLDLGLLGGAGAQLGGHLLAGGAVAGELVLELGDPLGDGLPEGRAAPRRAARRAARARLSAASWARRRSRRAQTLGVFARDALGLAALGGELALQLGAAHREGALVGGGAALLDQPGRVALLLERAGVVARGLAQRARRPLRGRCRRRGSLACARSAAARAACSAAAAASVAASSCSRSLRRASTRSAPPSVDLAHLAGWR